MFKRIFFMASLVCLISGAVNAQTQGCLVNGILYNTSSQAIPNTACGWVKVTASTWTSTQQNQCAGYGGVSGGFNQIPCPIDNYVWLFGSGIALIAVRKMKWKASLVGF